MPYEYEDADKLLSAFFGDVETACRLEGIPFEVVDEDSGFEEADDEDE